MPHPPSNPPHLAYPGNPAYADSPLESAGKCLVWGWCLVGGGCLLALVPILGMLVWFIATPLVITGFVLAIVSIVKGRTTGGVFLLLFSMFVAPFTLLLGPIISSLLGAAAATPKTPPPSLPGFSESAIPSSAPTTEAEMAAEPEEIKRQLDSKSSPRP